MMAAKVVLLTVLALLTPISIATAEYDTALLGKAFEKIHHQLLKLQIAYDEIRQENGVLKENIEVINNVNRQLHDQNSVLRNDVEDIKKKVDKLGLLDVRNPTRSVEFNNYRDRQVVSDISRRERLLIPQENNNQSEVFAAFSAQLHGDLNLGQKEDVVYGSVVTNLGNWYDNKHGHFTAPTKGIYLFSASMFTKPAEYVHLAMVRNGVTVAFLYSHNNGWDLSSQTIVLVLEKGDTVWMKHVYNGDTPGAATLEAEYNTFSGVLLHTLQ